MQASDNADEEFFIQVNGPLRKRRRSKRTWMEVLEIDFKKCNLPRYLAHDGSKWSNKIHVASPNTVGTRRQ